MHWRDLQVAWKCSAWGAFSASLRWVVTRHFSSQSQTSASLQDAFAESGEKIKAPRSLSSAQCLVLWSFWHISTQKRYANHAPVEGRPWKKWLGDFKAKPPSNVFVTFERHPMRKRPKILKHFVFGIGKGIRKVVPHQNFPFPGKLLQPKSSGSRWARTGKAQLRMDVPKFGQLEPLPQSRELAS